MVHLSLKNEMIASRKLHYKLLPIIPLLFEEGNPAGVKTVLKELGICDSFVRLPLVDISEALKSRLLHEVKKLA